MTTASKVTIARILLIPLFMAAGLLNFPHSDLIALCLFILASATDWLDGYIARRYDQITNFGKFMDPLADKLLVTSAMLLFVQWGRMSAWVLMVVLAREFAVSGLRMMAAAKGDVIAAAKSGKLKTVVTILGLCFMLATTCAGTLLPHMAIADTIVIVAILVVTVYSGLEYFAKNLKVLEEK